MKHEPAIRTHEADEPPPMVIHHPEEDLTLLAKWLKHALAKGPTFWLLAGGAFAIVLTVGYLISGLMAGQSTASRAWGEMMLASSTEDYQRVADTEAKTTAGQWAALRAASARYREGFARLPGDRESAAPILEQALEGFREVEKESQADPMLRRLAMLGVARTLETRDELSDAIAEYEKIAQTWPDSDDGKHAAERAKELKTPEAIAFYKKFAAFKPKAPATTIGPRGTNSIDLPAGHPALDGPLMPAPSLLDGGVPAGSVKSGELPRDPFQKSKAETAPAPSPLDDLLPPVRPEEPKAPAAAKDAPAAPK